MTQRYRYQWFAGLLMTSGLLLAGCGGPSHVRVTGAVNLDGQPLKACIVEFQPEDAKGKGASCVTNDKGEFRLVPDTPHKIIAPGAYVVTFRKYDDSKSKSQPGDAEGPSTARPNLVPRPYRDKNTSPFKVPLKEGMNKLDTFELSSAKGAPKGR